MKAKDIQTFVEIPPEYRIFLDRNANKLAVCKLQTIADMEAQMTPRMSYFEHHQVLAEAGASMAPGYETMDELVTTKSECGYWAKLKSAPKTSAA